MGFNQSLVILSLVLSVNNRPRYGIQKFRVNGFLTLSNSARFHDDASDWGVLFSHFLSMPNWNYNEVTVFASAIEVRQFFVKQEDHYRFNMNRIFPEQFAENDPTGDNSWDYDWACEHTGSKWFPCVDEVEPEGKDQSFVCYDTAWAPNNLTLLKISKITGWKIKNEYSEP